MQHVNNIIVNSIDCRNISCIPTGISNVTSRTYSIYCVPIYSNRFAISICIDYFEMKQNKQHPAV